jgi:hypothetical protein
MIVELETTDLTDELLLDIYQEYKSKIIDVKTGPNGFILIKVQGSEPNLLKLWLKNWSSMAANFEELEAELIWFKEHIVDEQR